MKWYLAALGAGLISTSLWAAETAPATSPAAIDECVKNLSATQWETRQSAQQKLIDMGPAEFRRLEAALPTADAESAGRLREILRQINRADVEHPTPITLHLKDTPAKDVLAEIARQADTEFVGDAVAGLTMPLTVDADHEPFWTVVLGICRQVHVTPAETGGIGVRAVTLKKGDEPAGRAAPTANGCFHIMPISAVSGGAVADRTIVGFRMLVDPKLTVLRATTFIKVDAVSDRQGNSLLYNAPFSSDAFSAYYNLVWGITSHIHSPADWMVGDFRGTVRVQALVKSEAWTVDRPLTADKDKPVHDLPLGRCALLSCTKLDPRNMRALPMYDIYNVSAAIDLAPDQTTALAGTTLLPGSIRAWDAAGQATPTQHFGTVTVSGSHLQFTTTLGAEVGGKRMGEIVRLEWDIPVATREFTVPVAFKNFSVQ